MGDLLVFASVNDSSESEATTLMISCAEKHSLIRSRINVFFQVIDDFVVLKKLGVSMVPEAGERLTINISCK